MSTRRNGLLLVLGMLAVLPGFASAAVSIHEAEFDEVLERSRTGGHKGDGPVTEAPAPSAPAASSPAGAAAHEPAAMPDPVGEPTPPASLTTAEVTPEEVGELVATLAAQGLTPVGILVTSEGDRRPAVITFGELQPAELVELARRLGMHVHGVIVREPVLGIELLFDLRGNLIRTSRPTARAAHAR